MGMVGSRWLTWGAVGAGVIGGVVGVVVAVIVSINFAINLGVPNGYEASIADVFRHDPVAGVVYALILIGGPISHRDALNPAEGLLLWCNQPLDGHGEGGGGHDDAKEFWGADTRFADGRHEVGASARY